MKNNLYYLQQYFFLLKKCEQVHDWNKGKKNKYNDNKSNTFILHKKKKLYNK